MESNERVISRMSGCRKFVAHGDCGFPALPRLAKLSRTCMSTLHLGSKTVAVTDSTPPAVATSVAFTEGPAVHADGTVYFSDIVGTASSNGGREKPGLSFASRAAGRMARHLTLKGGSCTAKGRSLVLAAAGA